MNVIKGRDIIVVGQQPWDTEIGSNCKNIALEFSKQNRVLYINSPLDRITKLRHKDDAKIQKRLKLIKENKTCLEQINPNLWVYLPEEIIESINWIKIGFVFDLLNKWNNRIIAKEILKAADKLHFNNYILFNDNDIFRSFYLKEYLKPTTSLYYSRDYLLAFGYWRHHGLRLEHKLMAKSDVCVANSRYLASVCEKYNKRSFNVGQGCDVELYQMDRSEIYPSDLSKIPGPIIGYTGALLASRLDLGIIKFISKQKPNWSIVLVGPQDDSFTKSDLHLMDNIYFLGSKDPSELPSYVKAFNVCINPQVVNELTIGNYPRKIDEYLAAGKPVVATMTETMIDFKEFCYLANNKEQYVQLIEKGLKEDSQKLIEDRKSFALTHTWENSVSLIYELISENEGLKDAG